MTFQTASKVFSRHPQPVSFRSNSVGVAVPFNPDIRIGDFIGGVPAGDLDMGIK
ncbi:MAG: hypothetical protein LH613_00610 [Chamaesiphon sp.]|nr:hypothetical protein [Chamaesiphon sp.]